MNYRTIALSLLFLTSTPAWASDLDGLDLTITIPTSPDAIYTYEDADGNTVTEGLPGYDDSASLPDQSDLDDENTHRTVTNYGESIAASATQTVNASIESKPDVDTTITPKDPSSIDDVAMRDCSHADIDCERSESTSSADVPAAATWIGVVTSAGNKMVEDVEHGVAQDDIRVFDGKAGTCRSKTVPFNVLRCCEGREWGGGLFGSCKQDEKDVSHAIFSQTAVYVQEYCSDWQRVEILGVTIDKWCGTYRQLYCVFSSKLDRIIQQQIRLQTKETFGTWDAPNCEGQHPDDLADIDLDTLNLSEYFDDAVDGVGDPGRPSSASIIAMLTDKISPPAPEPEVDPEPEEDNWGGDVTHSGGTPLRPVW